MRNILLCLLLVLAAVNKASSQDKDRWHWAIQPQYEDARSFFKGLTSVKKDGKWGCIDKQGRMVIPFQFEYDVIFSEGLACVKKDDKFGYINKQGQGVTLSQQFDYADSFSEGLARVSKKGKYGYINKQGQIEVPLQFDAAGSFSEGLATVQKDGKSGYIDKLGQVVIPFQQLRFGEFNEGLAQIFKENKYGFINKQGQVVIPIQFDNSLFTNFFEGLAPIRKDAKYGYIDKQGQVVIPFQFENARPFSEGLACVEKDGKYGYINKQGQVVIPFQFDQVGSFSQGLAWVMKRGIRRGGTYGYINKQGQMLIPFLFEDVSDFEEGLAHVKKDGKYGYISCDYPAEDFIVDHVKSLLTPWVAKGQYEKTLDYQNRVNEMTLEQKKQALIAEAIQEYGKSYVDLTSAQLGKYDADNEVFEVLFSAQPIYLPVPLHVAPQFEQEFAQVVFQNPKFGLQENDVVLTQVQALWKGKVYRYDSNVGKVASTGNPRSFDIGDIKIPSTPANESIKENNALVDPYDIRSNIPMGSTKVGPNSVAVIIANRDYASEGGITNVDYALEDGRLMKEYLIKAMGYQEGNVLVYENAAKGIFESVFGTESNAQGRLSKIVDPNGNSEIFIYYSGHGSPGGFNDSKPYFVPIECPPNEVSLVGYPLATFYKNLAKIPAKRKTVVIDACFSGREVIKNVSSVGIRANTETPQDQSTMVIASSKGDQPANWYPAKRQGLFTYFFLKAIHDYKNTDLNRDGHLSYDEIFQRVSDPSNGVPYTARRIGQPDQTPSLLGEGKNRSFLELKF